MLILENKVQEILEYKKCLKIYLIKFSFSH